MSEPCLIDREWCTAHERYAHECVADLTQQLAAARAALSSVERMIFGPAKHLADFDVWARMHAKALAAAREGK